MLVISKAQQQVFARAAAADFVERMVAHLRAAFPEQRRTVQQTEVAAFVRRGMERARRWNLEREFDICLYLHLMAELGERFDEDPNLPWARSALESERLDPGRRVSELHDRVFSHEDIEDGEGEEA